MAPAGGCSYSGDVEGGSRAEVKMEKRRGLKLSEVVGGHEGQIN